MQLAKSVSLRVIGAHEVLVLTLLHTVIAAALRAQQVPKASPEITWKGLVGFLKPHNYVPFSIISGINVATNQFSSWLFGRAGAGHRDPACSLMYSLLYGLDCKASILSCSVRPALITNLESFVLFCFALIICQLS